MCENRTLYSRKTYTMKQAHDLKSKFDMLPSLTLLTDRRGEFDDPMINMYLSKEVQAWSFIELYKPHLLFIVELDYYYEDTNVTHRRTNQFGCASTMLASLSDEDLTVKSISLFVPPNPNKHESHWVSKKLARIAGVIDCFGSPEPLHYFTSDGEQHSERFIAKEKLESGKIKTLWQQPPSLY